MDPVIPRAPVPATPRAIRYASYLMRAGAALQPVAAITALLTDRLMGAAFFGIFSLVAIMFWWWSARAARRAEPGTRISAVILLAWATMDVMKWQSGWEPLPVMTVFAPEWLAGLGATTLLFGKGSTAYFRQYRSGGRGWRWVRASLARAHRHPASGSGQ